MPKIRLFRSPVVASLVVALVIGCGGTDTGAGAGSPSSTGGAGGGMSGGAAGSSGRSAIGGSGGRGTGGSGNAAGAGGSRGGSGGTVGSGGARDAGVPSVCPGASPLPQGYTTCRTAADCPSPIYLCAPDPATGCGVGPPPPECYADSTCGSGKVCLQITPSGCSGVGSHCIPTCTGSSCAADEICASSGHCEPKPCTSGFACGGGTVCGPAKAGADAHGCAPATCSTDGYPCPIGYRCGAGQNTDPHGCSDTPCTESFKCPLNHDCSPASLAPHHCEPRACTADADCDCGACVGNVCLERLNVCSMLPS